MTYFWYEGIEIAVTTDRHDRPETILWDGRNYRVNKVTNRWIVDDKWWQHRIWRVYFELIADSTMLLVVFQDVVTKQWYVQRMYD